MDDGLRVWIGVMATIALIAAGWWALRCTQTQDDEGALEKKGRPLGLHPDDANNEAP